MKKLSIALALAVALAAIGVSAAGAVNHFPSSVTLSATTHSHVTNFSGTDSSPHGTCVPNRANLVKRVEPGPDVTVGTARSNTEGNYSLDVSKAAKGDYYTKERRKVLHNGDVCVWAKSSTVTVG